MMVSKEGKLFRKLGEVANFAAAEVDGKGKRAQQTWKKAICDPPQGGILVEW